MRRVRPFGYGRETPLQAFAHRIVEQLKSKKRQDFEPAKASAFPAASLLERIVNPVYGVSERIYNKQNTLPGRVPYSLLQGTLQLKILPPTRIL
jgi:hypothetical protein